jgi:hypothetical protein
MPEGARKTWREFIISRTRTKLQEAAWNAAEKAKLIRRQNLHQSWKNLRSFVLARRF